MRVNDIQCHTSGHDLILIRNKRQRATFPIPGAKVTIFDTVNTVDVFASFFAARRISRDLVVSIALYHSPRCKERSSTDRNEKKGQEIE